MQQGYECSDVHQGAWQRRGAAAEDGVGAGGHPKGTKGKGEDRENGCAMRHYSSEAHEYPKHPNVFSYMIGRPHR